MSAPGQRHVQVGRVRARDLLDDRQFLVGRRVIDDDVEHEPVELGLGQRVRAFLLDGVLRRQDEERLGQRDRSARRR